ncbi:Vgb family protein [Aquirhabdus parva]|uniref:YncE family protein n=1 Tax=Aquirhabdus parva TaxID=2283318 RepID=A0A345P9H0_9GAMM|nr:hypothetical protein [Aquirhabdus parva]AXI03929.1 hypothetical protein HYN46_14435 [Aquirhabdus parva]
MASDSHNPQVPTSFLDIEQHGLKTLHVPGFVDFMAAEADAIWATNQDRVEKYRLGSDTPIASVAVPAPVGVMVTAFGSLWVASHTDQAIYRVSLAEMCVEAVIPTGLADASQVAVAGRVINGTGELSIAAGAGSIWVVSDVAGVLSRIDPQSNTVIAQIAIAPFSYNVAFGHDALWVSNPKQGGVQRIDPISNHVVATIAVGEIPWFIAAGEGAVWSLNQGDGTVSRIDPQTHEVIPISLPIEAAGDGGDLTTGGGQVWVRTTGVLLMAIDPHSLEITKTYGPSAGVGSGGVMVAGDHVWVTAHDIDRVWVLNTR